METSSKRINYKNCEALFVHELKLVSNEHYFDAALVCRENIVLRAHKAVLSIASDFLKNVILTSEQEMCYISLPDVNHGIMHKVLKILYEGYVMANAEDMNNISEVLLFLGINFKAHVKGIDDTESETIGYIRDSPAKSSEITSDNTLFSRQSKGLSIGRIPSLLLMTDASFRNVNVESLLKFKSFAFPPAVTETSGDERRNVMYETACSEIEQKSPESSRQDASHTLSSSKSKSVSKIASVKKKNPALSDVFEYLENFYETNSHPNYAVYIQLQQKLKVSTRYLRSWFYRRRAKDKLRSIHSTAVVNSLQSQEVLRSSNVFEEENDSQNVDEREKENIPGEAVTDTPQTAGKALQLPYARKSFTNEANCYLEKVYCWNKYPTSEMYSALHKKVKIPKERICSWFKHRREKDKGSIHSTAVVNSLQSQEVVRSSNVLEEENDSNNVDEREKENIAEEAVTDMPQTAGTVSKVPSARKSFSNEANYYLEKVYCWNEYPTSEMYSVLNKKLKIPKASIRYWFKQRREKDKGSKNKSKSKIASFKKNNPAVSDICEYLENVYETNSHPNYAVYIQLQQKLKVSTRYLRSWFYRRRAKDKRGSIHSTAVVNSLQSQEVLRSSNVFEEENDSNNVDEREKENIPGESVTDTPQTAGTASQLPYARKSFTNEANCYLEKFYCRNKYPTSEMYSALHKKVKIPKERICSWFKHRREKDKGSPENVNRGSLETGDIPSDVAISQDQLQWLELGYKRKKKPIPSNKTIKVLSKKTGLTVEYILSWFERRRNETSSAADASNNFNTENEISGEDKNHSANILDETILGDQDSLSLNPSVPGSPENVNRGSLETGDIPSNVALSQDQLQWLELGYKRKKKPIPSNKTIKVLSKKTGLTVEYILSWFERRRNETSSAADASNNFNTENEISGEDKNHSANILDETILGDEDSLSLNPSVPDSRNTTSRKPKCLSIQQFTQKQKQRLMMAYSENAYRNASLCHKLAKELCMSAMSVRNWFRHTRSKALQGSVCKVASTTKHPSNIRRYLETIYQEAKFPTSEMYTELEKKLKLPRKSIRDWFVRRRKRETAGSVCKVAATTRYPSNIRRYLETIYQEAKFPTSEMYTELEKKLKLPRKSIRDWFVRRRKRETVEQQPEQSDDVKQGFPVDKVLWTKLSNTCTEVLENLYEKNKCPSKNTCQKLSKRLGLTPRQVNSWFIRRRFDDMSEMICESASLGENSNLDTLDIPCNEERIENDCESSFSGIHIKQEPY